MVNPMNKFDTVDIYILSLLLDTQNEPLTSDDHSILMLKHKLELFGFELTEKDLLNRLFKLKKRDLVKKRTRKLFTTYDIRFKISKKGITFCKRHRITPP